MWPPSGIALAVVIICGFSKVIPGIVIGITLLALKTSASTVTIFGLILSNLLEVVIAWMLLRSFGEGKFRFKSPKDVLGFIVIAAILAPFISSTITIAFLYFGSLLPVNELQSTWVIHFVGNGLGVLIVTPLIVTFFRPDSKKIVIWEAIALYIALAATCYWSFGGQDVRKFLIIPILTWCALRFSFRGISIAAIIVGYLAVWTSNNIHAVFSRTGTDDLLLIQMVMAGITIVGYFLATVGEAQEKAHEREIELTIKEDALAILDQSLHMSPIGFALIDKDYKYIRVNDALARINGIEANAHLGRSIMDVLPMIAFEAIPRINEVLRTGKSQMNIPFRGHPPQNPSLFIAGLLSYYPVRHPSSQEIFAVAFSFQDISEHLKIQSLLSENEERLRFAQEAGKIGAFEWDFSDNRIVWNRELENIYELEEGEFGGYFESWVKRIHTADVEEFKREMMQVLNGEKELNYEFRIITKSHETRWVLARGKIMKDGENRNFKFIGINIDITDQKVTEQKLRVTEANLLNALSIRDEFLAIASHELKTPLTSLKLQIQLFQRGIAKKDPGIFTPDKIVSFIDKNSVQIDKLTRLVDDMLDIARIRTGKFSLRKEPCELSSMLNEILARTKEQFEASGSGQPVIEHIERAFGEWDPLRIEQVLLNIITNAIRYGQGKPIFISIKNYQESVRVTVRDQGLGITPSDQEKIFKRYERGLLGREVSGLGLGLFITRQIIEGHGGKIWLESEINQGSTFFVDLPRTSLPVILTEENSSLKVSR